MFHARDRAPGGRVFAELHDDVYKHLRNLETEALRQLERAKLTKRVDLALVRDAVRTRSGVPVDVTRRTSKVR